MNNELLNQHLDALERIIQELLDRTEGLSEGKEFLAPALYEVSQALTTLRAARLEATPDSSESVLHQAFEPLPDRLTANDGGVKVILSNRRGHELITPEEQTSLLKCYRFFLHRDRPCEPCKLPEGLATGQPV